MWAGQHYVTFDRQSYSFPSRSTYSMVQDCVDGKAMTYQVFVNQTYECDDDGYQCLAAVKVRVTGARPVALNPTPVTAIGSFYLRAMTSSQRRCDERYFKTASAAGVRETVRLRLRRRRLLQMRQPTTRTDTAHSIGFRQICDFCL